MMIENTRAAVIYFKNGTRKYGMLLERQLNDAYQFISNANYFVFEETKNEKYIESVPCSLIETIDTDLK
jgi:hypothetical protein